MSIKCTNQSNLYRNSKLLNIVVLKTEEFTRKFYRIKIHIKKNCS